MKKKICIDAGHYGKYNQSPVHKSYWESDMTWKLHLLLKSALENRGFEVITTRSSQATDLGLEKRGKASKGCDLFISLHSNASSDVGASYSVACCMIDDKNVTIDDISVQLGKKLADKVTELMTGKFNGGTVWRRKGDYGDYYGVIRGAKSVGTPAILLEHGFHTNLGNTLFLLDENNLKTIASAEADIIADFFNVSADEKVFEPYLVKIISADGYVNIRKTPAWSDSDIVGKIETGNTKYTIVAETVIDGTKFGKLKSGAGWISLNPKYTEIV
ncbi:MAG: N-acetylmuramoyl-L-alanine amidase [Oscillospiraceae bacterium]